MENVRDQTIRYLQDLHAAEKVTEDILDKLADDAEAISSLRVVAGESVLECVNRRETIAARVAALGGSISSMKDFANSTLGVLSDIYNAGHSRADKITMDAIKAHAALHLLHASYCALNVFTQQSGDSDTAEIASRYLTESTTSAERLIPAIEASARATAGVLA